MDSGRVTKPLILLGEIDVGERGEGEQQNSAQKIFSNFSVIVRFGAYTTPIILMRQLCPRNKSLGGNDEIETVVGLDSRIKFARIDKHRAN